MGPFEVISLWLAGSISSGIGAYILWRREEALIRHRLEVERHDWNNRSLPLLLEVASLRLRLSRLPTLDPAILELAREIEDQSLVLVKGSSRLDKLLIHQVDRLHCSSKCPGCRQVDQQAVVLLTNLTANAREAKAKSQGGEVVARCDRETLTIENPTPSRKARKGRAGLGLGSAKAGAKALGWSLDSREREDGSSWEAVVQMTQSEESSGG